MKHKICKVTSVKTTGDYILLVGFHDGTQQEIDFSFVLEGELYGPLRNINLFNRVQVDPEVHTLVWPNGADFDPATLHDWSEYASEFAKMAKRWSEMSSNEPEQSR